MTEFLWIRRAPNLIVHTGAARYGRVLVAGIFEPGSMEEPVTLPGFADGRMLR
jgi:hypothetical protein